LVLRTAKGPDNSPCFYNAGDTDITTIHVYSLRIAMISWPK